MTEIEQQFNQEITDKTLTLSAKVNASLQSWVQIRDHQFARGCDFARQEASKGNYDILNGYLNTAEKASKCITQLSIKSYQISMAQLLTIKQAIFAMASLMNLKENKMFTPENFYSYFVDGYRVIYTREDSCALTNNHIERLIAFYFKNEGTLGIKKLAGLPNDSFDIICLITDRDAFIKPENIINPHKQYLISFLNYIKNYRIERNKNIYDVSPSLITIPKSWHRRKQYLVAKEDITEDEIFTLAQTFNETDHILSLLKK